MQVVLDQAVYDGGFIQEFNEAEYKLKAVSTRAYQLPHETTVLVILGKRKQMRSNPVPVVAEIIILCTFSPLKQLFPYVWPNNAVMNVCRVLLIRLLL